MPLPVMNALDVCYLISEPKQLCPLHVSLSQMCQNVPEMVSAMQKLNPSIATVGRKTGIILNKDQLTQ